MSAGRRCPRPANGLNVSINIGSVPDLLLAGRAGQIFSRCRSLRVGSSRATTGQFRPVFERTRPLGNVDDRQQRGRQQGCQHSVCRAEDTAQSRPRSTSRRLATIGVARAKFTGKAGRVFSTTRTRRSDPQE